jgi:putative transposase
MARKRKHQVQLELPPPRTWGGARKGAGRKKQSPGQRLPHRARPAHLARHPVHVTLRASRDLPSLREWRLAQILGLALRAAAARKAEACKLRVIHFSIQRDHLHLIVEAGDERDLSNGMRGLVARMARAVNRELGRRGPLTSDRYHARPLRTPREVRNALVYVLGNWRKHSSGDSGDAIDPMSSARWFNGWARPVDPSANPPPVHAATSWLARTGWRLHGLILPEEAPKSD